LISGASADGANKLIVNGGIKGTTGTYSGSVTTTGSLISEKNEGDVTLVSTSGSGKTFRVLSGSDGNMYFQNVTGGSVYPIIINGTTSALTVNSLAGTGDRMVQASSTGVLSATQVVTSGTYTPTLTNTTNLSASTLSYATYTRIGNVVHVNIGLGLTPTLSATNTVLTVTLPFTAVNGTQNYVGSGTVFGNLASNLFASGMVNVTSTTQATFTFYSTALTASSANFQFQYILN